MNKAIGALVPKTLRPRFRGAYNYVRHKLYLTKLFGHYASLIPPLELMHDGPVGFEEFKTNGEEFFRYYTQLCDLKPHEKMLDVGSGIGRKTFLLTDYLNDEGSYEGLDIVRRVLIGAPNELPASDLVRGDTILGAILFDPLDLMRRRIDAEMKEMVSKRK